jgi:hypothetical protein
MGSRPSNLSDYPIALGYVIVGPDSSYKVGQTITLKKNQAFQFAETGLRFFPNPLDAIEAYRNPFAPGNKYFRVKAIGRLESRGGVFETDKMYIERSYHEVQFRAVCTASHKDHLGNFRSYAMGRLHSINDQPAKISGDMAERGWFEHGIEHRADKPSHLVQSQICKAARWCEKGEMHRVYGPAVIMVNRRFVILEFRRRGILHNSYGPAFVEWCYDPCQKKIVETAREYWLNGKPAKADDMWQPRADEDFDLDGYRNAAQSKMYRGEKFWDIVQALFAHWIN